GPNPCATLLAEPKYTKIVDKYPDWDVGDTMVAVAMLIDAAALPPKINEVSSSMWSNKDIFGALTANCNLYRSASDFHDLTSSVPPEKWTKEQRERVIGLIGVATGIRLVRLQ